MFGEAWNDPTESLAHFGVMLCQITKQHAKQRVFRERIAKFRYPQKLNVDNQQIYKQKCLITVIFYSLQALLKTFCHTYFLFHNSILQSGFVTHSLAIRTLLTKKKMHS